MNIEQARETALLLRTHIHPNILSIDRRVMADGAAVIDGLIAERDAQRKVLEQALEALESWERLAPDLALPEYAEAITAIQEVLAP